MKTAAQIAAHVAVEAIAEAEGDGYSPETIAAVLANGVAEGVAPMYLNMITPLLRCTCDAVTRAHVVDCPAGMNVQ